MKKILLFIALLTIVAFPQEHRFKGTVKVDSLRARVVRADNLVGVSDSISTKLDKNFTGLATNTTPSVSDYVPINSVSGTLQKVSLATLPISSVVQSALNNLEVTKTPISDFAITQSVTSALQDSVTKLRSDLTALKELMSLLLPKPLAPLNPYTIGSPKEIDIFFTENGQRDSTYIYRSNDNITYIKIAVIDSGTNKTYKDSGLVAGAKYYYKLRNKLNTPELYSAFTDSVSGTYPSNLLWRVDFEEGNKSDLDGTDTGTPSLLTASDTSDYNSRYGGLIKFNGTNTQIYNVKTTSGINKVSGGFYIYIPSTLDSGGSYSNKPIFVVKRSSNYKVKIEFQCNSVGLPNVWMMEFNDVANNAYSSNYNFTFNTWHHIEFEYFADISNGYGKMWVDGNLVVNVTGRNTDNSQPVTGFQFGFQNSTVYTAGNYLKLDEFILYNLTTTVNRNWYVDKNATGTGTGLSWTNAFPSFSTINWSAIIPGDTLFISGGTDSTVYNSQLIVPTDKSGTAALPIIITKGRDAGHNGTVVLDGQEAYPYVVQLQSVNYIKLRDLKIKGIRSSFNTVNPYHAYQQGRGIVVSLTKGVEVSNCIVLHNYGEGIYIDRSDSVRILNNYIYTETVDSSTETDGIYMQWAVTNIEVAYNTFIERNKFLAIGLPYSHKDVIQISGSGTYGWNTNGKIHHNFAIRDLGGVNDGAGFYLRGLDGTWEVYNNVIGGTFGNDGSLLGLTSETTDNTFKIKVYNNTLATTSPLSYVLEMNRIDSAYVYNNLFYEPNSTDAEMWFYGTILKSDYNRYYNSTTVARDNSNHYTFAQWQALGYEANGSSGAFSFVNFGSTTLADWKTTGAWTGIGLGVSNTIATDDILGISRPQNTTWDIGAFER